MKTFCLVSAGQQTLLMTALFLTLILSLFLLLTVFGRHRSRGKRYLHIFVFLFLFLFLYVLTDAFAKLNAGLEPAVRPDAPMWLLWCVVAAADALFLWEIDRLRRTRGRTLGRGCVKEAMDRLPSGICYFTADGAVKLCNLQMHRLFRTLADSDLQQLSELRGAIDSGGTGNTVRLPEDRNTFLFPDGRVWRYRQTQVTDHDGNVYTEAIFSDLTELYKKNLELRRQTEKLKENARELRRLSDNVLILTREKEVLAAKTQLHDRMGAGLTAVRLQLCSRGSGGQTAAVELLRRAVSALKNDNEYPPEKGDLEKFLQDAETIGVKVELSGTLPESGELSRIIILAMRECLTNSVRHAGATELTARICGDGETVSVRVTNDGAPPKGEVKPKGGLQNLYRNVLDFGGSMEIQSRPVFALTVTLPRREEEKP